MNKTRHIPAAISGEIYSRIFNACINMLSLSRISDGKFIEVNQACTALLGYTREEMIGRTSLELRLYASPADREKLQNAADQDGRVRNAEIQVRAKDGRVIDAWFSAEKISYNGEACWLVEVADISRLKEAGKLLRETSERLADTAAMLQLVLDTIPVRIFWKDTSLKYLGCNLSLARDAGREKPGDLIGDTDDHMAWAEQAELYTADDRAVISSGQARIGYEEPQTTPAGEKIWLRTTKVPLRDASGNIIGVMGTYEDITARKIAENERTRLIMQLRETNADMENFASTASHDLHEPLRMVAGFAALFRKKYQGALDAEADRYIAYIVDGVTRMHKLIADILKLARAGINRRKPFLIHAGDALDDALHNLEGQIASRDVLLSMDEMPDVWFEHVELCQVFQNLIANALKFARRNHKLFIHIGARSLEKEWEFSVSDNGIGMKPEDTAKIFMPFGRLHESEEYPGSGIGLSICKKIVEHYGGKIRVESSPGHGSTFFFTIPKIVTADTH